MKPVSLAAMPLMALASINAVQAQDMSDVPPCVEVPMDERQRIILVSGGLAEPMGDKAYAIDRITPPDGPAERLETALLAASGLQQFRRSDARSANPTSQGVTLRGLGGSASSRALLILDGVPQSDPFGGWVSWPGYDAIKLAGIRIRRGGGIGSDGPGALAGTIELTSDGVGEASTASIAYGSRASLDATAHVARDVGRGHVSLSGSFARGDGFVPVRESQRGTVDRRAPHRQYGLALRADAPLHDDVTLRTSLRGFDDRRERGFAFSQNRNSGIDASVQIVARPAQATQWSLLAYVQTREFSSQFGAINAQRSTVTPTLDQYAVPATGLGARAEIRPWLGSDVELRIGADWRRTSGETREDFTYVAGVATRNRIAGGRTGNWGGYAELSADLDALTLTAGGRLDRWTIADGFRREVNIGGTVRSDDGFADRSGWEGTARAGAAWKAGAGITLRGAAYLGWRLPTLNELFRPFRVGSDAVAANELLAPERLRGAEIGVEWGAAERSGLRVTAFVNRLDNAIANVSLGQGPGNFPGVGFVAAGGIYRQRRNLDGIDSKGVEIEGRLVWRDVRLMASYAYVDARVLASGPAAMLDGLRPAQVPRHFGSIGGTWQNGPLTLDMAARYVGQQFEDDLNSLRLREAFTIDAGIDIKLTDNISLGLRAENLFDVGVDSALSSNGIIERGTPRTIWLAATVSLD